MKKAFLFFFIIRASNLHAQAFDEWVKQKETRVKYMLQQIAANKVYIGYLQKAYRIAQSGLQTINDIKHGDLNLHRDFFDALASVNPKIKNVEKVTAIVTFQIQMIKESQSTIRNCGTSNQFTSRELSYLQHVFDHLLGECAKNLNELIGVITSGEIEMSDDERIRRVDKIYNDMQDKLSFSKSFSGGALTLALQRRNEQADIEVSKKLNGIQ